MSAYIIYSIYMYVFSKHMLRYYICGRHPIWDMHSCTPLPSAIRPWFTALSRPGGTCITCMGGTCITCITCITRIRCMGVTCITCMGVTCITCITCMGGTRGLTPLVVRV